MSDTVFFTGHSPASADLFLAGAGLFPVPVLPAAYGLQPEATRAKACDLKKETTKYSASWHPGSSSFLDPKSY